MKHILLLGAGFSRNWGGWLVSEVFEFLIAHKSIINDNELRSLLMSSQANGGFENAFSTIQENYKSTANPKYKNQLEIIQSAVIDMFNDMNDSLFNIKRRDIRETVNPNVTNFLDKFDAVFTLNQDLLVEYLYDQIIYDSTRDKRRMGLSLPGMQRASLDTTGSDSHCSMSTLIPNESYKFDIKDCNGKLPYFKLHGSSNWFSNGNDKPLLIIGGSKSAQITNLKILKTYFEIFKEFLAKPNIKLMIIGYGFADAHIIKCLKNQLNFIVLKYLIYRQAVLI